MKKLFWSSLLVFGVSTSFFGQTKSSGTVTLTSGYTLKIDLDKTANMATFTMAGPSTKWLSIGLNTTVMPTGGDCLSYNTQLLDQHFTSGHNSPATDAANNLTLVSATTSGSTKTIIFTRSLSTGDSNDYVFNYDNLSSLNVIWAIGTSNTNQEHGLKGVKSLNFTALGTEDFSVLEQSLKVFPNPSDGLFKIEGNDKVKITKIKVFDINAKLIKTIDFDVNEEMIHMDLTGLTKGTYFLELSNNVAKTVKKIQIN